MNERNTTKGVSSTEITKGYGTLTLTRLMGGKSRHWSRGSEAAKRALSVVEAASTCDVGESSSLLSKDLSDINGSLTALPPVRMPCAGPLCWRIICAHSHDTYVRSVESPVGLAFIRHHPLAVSS